MSVRLPLTALAVAFAALVPALQATAQGIAGPYLAARQASIDSDFRAASEYFTRGMMADPSNPAMLENVIRSFVGLGEVEKAVAVARRMQSMDAGSQIASMTLLAQLFKKQAYDVVLQELDEGLAVGPMVDGLLTAWAELGLGRMSEALESFDAVATSQGIEIFGLYHKALALAMVGDFESADDILSGRDSGTLGLTRRGVIAHIEILSQLERNEDAIALMDERFGVGLDPELLQLRAALEAGETLPFTILPDPDAGAAEVFHVVAGALSAEAAEAYTLMYSRMAEYLRPGHVDAILMSAGLLERLDRYELATEAYNLIPQDHPAFDAAEIGRAEALRESGNDEAGIEVLRQLARTRPDNPAVHVTLGDALRQLERYDEASQAYDDAIALYDTREASQWIVYFARGITHEREDRWEQAEKDFRFALELRPDQPQVLNYLGYSFVEMGVNMDEALDMIERAVAASPDSGYITDSLGWVLFRTGDYQEAVGHLERATELLPIDPIVNDHLGDAYWAVGRTIEAEFQWKRALSFDPEEKDAERIRRKLEVGLDVVLEEEGAAPINVANDG